MTDARFRVVYRTVDDAFAEVPHPQDGHLIALECGNGWLQDYECRNGVYKICGPRYLPATMD